MAWSSSSSAVPSSPSVRSVDSLSEPRSQDIQHDDEYADESFANDEPASEAPTASLLTTQGDGEVESQAYDDDGFEEVADEPQGENETEQDSAVYEDDFEVAEESTFLGTSQESPSLTQNQPNQSRPEKHETVKTIDAKAPPLPEQWAQERTAFVLLRRRMQMSNQSDYGQALIPRPIPGSVLDELVHRVTHRQSKPKRHNNQEEHKPHRSRMKVSASVLERARLDHLLALSGTPPPPASPVHYTQRSTSTFCSIKTATLKGRLATNNLSDMQTRWYAPGDSPSIGVLEFMADAARRQREVLGPREDTLFTAFKTTATSIDRAAQQAHDTVRDSKKLMREASRILQARNACQCSCFGSRTSS